MQLIGGSHTNQGAFRENNEDAVFLHLPGEDAVPVACGAVCDGIGGLEHGEFASAFIISEMQKWLETILGWLDPAHLDAEILFSHLKDGAEEWNLSLYRTMQENAMQAGTTMSCILTAGTQYAILHVGDSRIYRYRPKTGLQALTVDASIARMKNGQMRTYLENYMGKQEELLFEYSEGELLPGDLIFFCSDGFYHHLEEEDVQAVYQGLQSGTAPDALCACAVQTMISRGERDNISVGVLYAWPEERRHGLLSLFGKS